MAKVHRTLAGAVGVYICVAACGSDDTSSGSVQPGGSGGADAQASGGTGGLSGSGGGAGSGLPAAGGAFSTLANPFVLSSFDTLEWGAGTIDESLFVEGTGSLRWEHAVDADGCFEYGGEDFCYLRLERDDYPLDLSEFEFISMWVHNDTHSGYDTSYHETYYEPVPEAGWIRINFIYEGGIYVSIVRLDYTGWRQYAMEKGSFAGSENTEGWGAITDIHVWVKPATERIVHLDNMTVSVLPPGNVPARWLATFESGSYDPDIGSRLPQGQHVFDEENNISQFHLEYTTIVDNPVPSERNPSSKVFKSYVPQQGYIRAEYEASSVPTEEKTHIYAWKEYLPSATFDNVDFHFLALGQWKTYPCTNTDSMCGGGGIFNDRSLILGDPDQLGYRFRAEPDCHEPAHDFPKDVWTSYALEVYWTNTNNGYYSLFQDGELLFEQSDIKTLFDGFEAGSCDMKWALGVYSRWWSAGDGTEDITYYLDDMAIFDRDHGVTIDEVLAWQGWD